MYSNLWAGAILVGNAEEGYEQQLKGLEIYEGLKRTNNLVIGMYIEQLPSSNFKSLLKKAEAYMLKCLDMLPDLWEHLLDISFIQYILAFLNAGWSNAMCALAF